MKFKISPPGVEILKRCAHLESSPILYDKQIILEPGVRFNTVESKRPRSINIALVSDDPMFNDTDLDDYGEWKDFRKTQTLTKDGRGIFDFYIRRRGDEYHDLHGNITVYVEAGKLDRVRGYGDVKWLWTIEGGFA